MISGCISSGISKAVKPTKHSSQHIGEAVVENLTNEVSVRPNIHGIPVPGIGRWPQGKPLMMLGRQHVVPRGVKIETAVSRGHKVNPS